LNASDNMRCIRRKYDRCIINRKQKRILLHTSRVSKDSRVMHNSCRLVLPTDRGIQQDRSIAIGVRIYRRKIYWGLVLLPLDFAQPARPKPTSRRLQWSGEPSSCIWLLGYHRTRKGDRYRSCGHTSTVLLCKSPIPFHQSDGFNLRRKIPLNQVGIIADNISAGRDTGGGVRDIKESAGINR